jgi:hypothetical protein
MVREHSESILDISHKYLKCALNFTLPLAGSLLIVGRLMCLSGGVETPIINIVECYLI